MAKAVVLALLDNTFLLGPADAVARGRQLFIVHFMQASGLACNECNMRTWAQVDGQRQAHGEKPQARHPLPRPVWCLPQSLQYTKCHRAPMPGSFKRTTWGRKSSTARDDTLITSWHYTVVASARAERPHWYAHEVREPVSVYEELLPYLESGVHNGTTIAY